MMTNKQLINKIKDNAKLACASYGYFHLIKDDKGVTRKRYDLEKRKKDERVANKSYLR